MAAAVEVFGSRGSQSRASQEPRSTQPRPTQPRPTQRQSQSPQAHASEIDDGTFVLPRDWWASSSAAAEAAPAFVRDVPRHEALLRQTCAGCHAQTERGFQIDPLAVGTKRLSRFLSAPDEEDDELRRRAAWMQLTLWSAR